MDQATHNRIHPSIRGIADDVLRDLKSHGNHQQLLADFGDCLKGCLLNVQDSFDNFKLRNQLTTLSNADALGRLAEISADILAIEQEAEVPLTGLLAAKVEA